MAILKSTYCLTEVADALEMSQSGFYAHQRKAERPRARQDRELASLIQPIFLASRKTYGSPRMMHALRKKGWRCGKNRIARLMRERGLRARQPRKLSGQTRNNPKRS